MMEVAGARRPLTFDSAEGSGPRVLSAGTDWAGLPLEMHRLVPVETNAETGPLDGEHGVLVVLDGSADVVVRKLGTESTHAARPGSASLMSGDDRPTIVRITGTAETVAIHMEKDWLGRLETAPPALGRTRAIGPNETLRSIARTMCTEVAQGGKTGRLFAESLSLAFLSYVTARFGPDELGALRGFSSTQRRRLVAYVKDRLQDDLSLTDLAGVVGLGPRHFSTLFRRAFGTSPHRYVVGQRLEEGARLLASGKHDIAEIALAVGFSSQSHFTTAFRHAFGITPRHYSARAGAAFR
jgi:AraC family transcriptional regulator